MAYPGGDRQSFSVDAEETLIDSDVRFLHDSGANDVGLLL